MEKKLINSESELKEWANNNLPSSVPFEKVVKPESYPCVVCYYVNHLGLVSDKKIGATIYEFVYYEDFGLRRQARLATCLDFRTTYNEDTLYKELKNFNYSDEQIKQLVEYVFTTPIEELQKQVEEKISFNDICKKLGI